MPYYNDEFRLSVCPDCRGTGVVTDISTFAMNYSRCPTCEGTGFQRRPLTNLDFLNAISIDPTATAQFLVDWCQEKAWRKDVGCVEAWLLEPRYKKGSIINDAKEDCHYMEKTEDSCEV